MFAFDIEVLRALEAIRTPFFNVLLGAVTYIRAGNVAIWMAVLAARSMAAYAAMVGPSARTP